VTCNAGSATIPSAVVALWHQDGTILREAALGDGPVDAVFKAIERITGIEVTLRDYRVRSVSVGEDALGEASVEAEFNGKVVAGRAVSTDVIEASALAFLQVINRFALRSKYLGERIKPTQNPPPEPPAAPRAEATQAAAS
jgi:2-isopropylmalate synthase